MSDKSPTRKEQNPPLGGNCGWGEPEDPIHHKFYKERIAAEKNEDEGVYSTIKELIVARGPETDMEKLIREAMPYDDGWDCDFVDKLLYGGPAYVDQDGVGSCVGAGAGSAVATAASTEIILEGDPENPFAMQVVQYSQDNLNCAVPMIDFHYGCGKMKSAWNGEKFTSERRLGDGSYCSAQIWALMTCGVLPCFRVKDSGLVYPQSKNIRSHAGNNGQFLNRHLEFSLKHRMKDSTRVNSADDLKEVITVLKRPCMICSGKGFKPSHEVEGLGWVYVIGGSWAHNMTLVSFILYKGKWYVKVRNQWGSDAHKDGWTFWITVETFAAWVKSAECQSIGEMDLVPSKAIPAFPF